MSDKTIQNRFVARHQALKKGCTYGLTHFCDGTPNKSECDTENAVHKKRCPNYHDCEIRKHSIYEERE